MWGVPILNKGDYKMRKHRIYYGFLKSDHYFVEVKPALFDEWNVQDVRNITHKDIIKWNLKERGSHTKTLLMAFLYFKRGCGDTVKLLKTVGRKGVEYAYQRD